MAELSWDRATDHADVGTAGRISRVLHVLGVFFSFEFLFVLYMYAGRYKADPRLQWIEVDLTALLFCASVAVGCLVLARHRFRLPAGSARLAFFAVLFVSYIAASLTWTVGYHYAEKKTLYMGTLALWPLIACAVLIAFDRVRVQRFMLALVVFASWLCIETALALTTGRYEGTVIAYIALAQVIATSAVIVFGYMLFFARTLLTRAVAAAIFSCYIYVLLHIGARGPMVAVAVAVVTALVLRPRRALGASRVRRYVLQLTGLIVLAGFVTLAVPRHAEEARTLARFDVLFRPGGGASAQARLYSGVWAVKLWLQRPVVGHGIGSWPIIMGIGDQRAYPHNLVLEILAELGLLGLLLFALVAGFALRCLGPISEIRRDPLRILICMIFMSCLFNSMVSGHLPDNRLLFAVIGLMAFGGAGSGRPGAAHRGDGDSVQYTR